MSEPLSCCGGVRDPVQHSPGCPSIVRASLSWIEDTNHGERVRQKGLAAFEVILARVAELEKERDERLSVEAADQWLAHRFHEVCDRAEAAEAGLAAAQEALKKGREFERAYQESLGATWTAPMQERLDSLQSAFIDAYVDVLARGGGQQETR